MKFEDQPAGKMKVLRGNVVDMPHLKDTCPFTFQTTGAQYQAIIFDCEASCHLCVDGKCTFVRISEHLKKLTDIMAAQYDNIKVGLDN